MIKESKWVLFLGIQLLFTAFYTLTVLPYTVRFFQSVATLPSMDMLLGAIPLSEAHRFALPFFLAFLEFTAVFIACLFWTSERKKLTLLLFLACQLLPVVSTYYEIGAKDYAVQKEVLETIKGKNIQAKKDEIERVKQSIENRQRQIEGMEQAGVSKIDKIRNQIAKELQDARKNEFDVATHRKDASALIRERQNLSKIGNELRDKIEAQRLDVKSLEDHQQELERALFLYAQAPLEGLENSGMAYIAGRIFTGQSALAAFISMIFPVTILGFSFWLTKLKETADTRSFFHLQQHLEYASVLPQELHLEYARGLLPSISAHVAAIKASGEIANNSVNLNLQYGNTLRMLSDIESLKKQIVNSKLAAVAKDHLNNAVEKITANQIFSKKEEGSYA